MPTMKDIAKLANVSYGTVSNVLNNRGNVVLEKIKRVENVARELGYQVNTKAKSLRSSNNNEFSFVVPSINIYKYRKLYNLLRKKLSLQDITLNILISDHNPFIEEQIVYNAAATNDVIFIISCIKNPEKIYSNKIFHNTKLIFIDTGINISSNQNYHSVSFDTLGISDDLTHFIELGNYKNVLLFSSNELYKEVFKQLNKNVIYKYCESTIDILTSIQLMQKNTYDLIISTSFEKYEAIIKARSILQNSNQTKFVTIVSNKMQFDKSICYYYQDMNHYAEEIFRILSNSSDRRYIRVSNVGFIKEESYVETMDNKSDDEVINILMIESPTASAIKTINPYLESCLGFKVNIDVFKYNQYDVILDKGFLENYDIVRIDMAYLPKLAEKIFKPIEQIYQELKDNLIIDLEEYTMQNGIHYTLPLDIGCQILMYRDDILNDQKIKREYFEKTKSPNTIPKTFDDFNNLELFFDKNYHSIYYGSTVCNGSDLTRAGEFLARVRSKNILDENNDLNIKNPEVLHALKSFLTSISFSSKRNNEFWDQTIKEYAEGKTVMSITFSNYIHLLSEINNDIAYKTKYTVPPYHKALIGGGVIGLTSHTKKENACFRYFKLLYSSRISKLITYLGGTMPTKSIYSDISLKTLYPWIDFIPEIIKKNTRKYYNKNSELLDTISYERKIGEELRKYLTYNVDIRK